MEKEADEEKNQEENFDHVEDGGAVFPWCSTLTSAFTSVSL